MPKTNDYIKQSSLKYLALLKEFCLKRRVRVCANIFNRSGRLLIHKGSALNESQVKRLRGQRLLKPLASCIQVIG